MAFPDLKNGVVAWGRGWSKTLESATVAMEQLAQAGYFAQAKLDTFVYYANLTDEDKVRHEFIRDGGMPWDIETVEEWLGVEVNVSAILSELESAPR